MNYSASKICKIFSLDTSPPFNKEDLLQAERTGNIPKQSLISLKKRSQKIWSPEQLPAIGEKFGFMEKPKHTKVMTTFVTKGGVLKTSLTLNFARMAALHNINTCVIGLDMQGDITSGLGYNYEVSDQMNMEEALIKIQQTKGLMGFYKKNCELEDIIIPTELPTLSFIPETPELVALNQALNHKNKREYWLADEVVEPLKEQFDLILFDCSPNWNLLITNALVACESLLIPLECKINNFRNLKMFQSFLEEFKSEMNLTFSNHYIPTRASSKRKLSREILHWYQENVSGCSQYSVRESLQGEEASALYLSIPEYAPLSPSATEMNLIIDEAWQTICPRQKTRKKKWPQKNNIRLV